MGYYVYLKSISIEKYKKILRKTELIPSWKILEDDIDRNLDILKKYNIRNLDELLIALKDKTKIQEFSKQSGLSPGYRQKPNRIRDFSCLSEDVIGKLDKLGFKNTLKLYDTVITPEKRSEFSKKLGISKDEMMKLTKLTDLSRIRWVNHTFAYVLLESGYDTTEKVANADYKKLYETIKQLNDDRKIYNAHIGERDMKMIIDFAQQLDFEIEY